MHSSICYQFWCGADISVPSMNALYNNYMVQKNLCILRTCLVPASMSEILWTINILLYISATLYEIRYSKVLTEIMNSTLWENLKNITEKDVVGGNLTSMDAGQIISFEVPLALFEADTIYFLAIKALDEGKLSSPMSNPVQMSTLPPPVGEESGLSGGAIAGIVIGALLVVLLVAVLAYLAIQKRK